MRSISRSKAVRQVDWPIADRDAWAKAIADGGLFDERGLAARWSAATRRAGVYGYGRWIAHLQRTKPAALRLESGARVTRETVRSYVDALQSEATPNGVFIFVRSLYDMIRVMEPAHEWFWLKDLKGSLSRKVHPRAKAPHIVPAADLFRLGLELMDTADALPDPSYLAREIQFRDGLLISVLAFCLVRRRNLAGTYLGKNLIAVGDGFALVYGSEETKNRQALEFRVPDQLVPYIKRYLLELRPHFPKAARHDGLWASAKGRPMSSATIFDRVVMRTKAAFGHPVGLQQFRHFGATSIAREDPGQVLISRDLLGHLSFSTTEKFYIMAEQTKAAERYQEIVLALDRESKSDGHRRKSRRR